MISLPRPFELALEGLAGEDTFGCRIRINERRSIVRDFRHHTGTHPERIECLGGRSWSSCDCDRAVCSSLFQDPGQPGYDGRGTGLQSKPHVFRHVRHFRTQLHCQALSGWVIVFLILAEESPVSKEAIPS